MNMFVSFLKFVFENEELVRMILWPYLQVNDIITLSMTSKQFDLLCIATNERILQQSIKIREHGEYEILRMVPINQIKSINRMLKLFPNITSLIFSSSSKKFWEGHNFFDPDYCEYLDIKILSILYRSKQLQNTLLSLSLPIKCGIELKGVGSFTNLTKLEIFSSEIVSDELCNEMRKLKYLTSLTLNACTNLKGDFLNEIGDNLINLTELDLSYCDKLRGFDSWLTDDNRSIPYLTSINISGTMINASDFDCIFRLLGCSLVRLILNDCSELNLSKLVIEYNKWKTCSRYIFTHLETLSLKHNSISTFQEILFITKLKSLTSLDLEGCSSIFQNHGLKHLSTLSNLIMLNIDECNITDEIIKRDLPILPNLQILDLSHMYFAKFAPEEFPLYRLQSLKSLKLINCHYGTIVSWSFCQHIKNITFLDLTFVGVGVNEIEIFHLASLTYLKTLLMSNTVRLITHIGLQLLSNLTNLIILDISDTEISGNGISQHLSKLYRLSSLKLARCKLIDGNGSVDFSMFPATLTYLDVSGFESNCHSMNESIFSLQALKYLDISRLSNEMNDITMLRLSNSLTNLETLLIYRSLEEVTNTGLSSLSLLVNLKYLLINDNQFEDSCIFRLQSLTQKGLRIELV